MGIPIGESVQLPLLRVIADAGGELPMKEAVKRVERFFPELTEEDKRRRLPSGASRRAVRVISPTGRAEKRKTRMIRHMAVIISR